MKKKAMDILPEGKQVILGRNITLSKSYARDSGKIEILDDAGSVIYIFREIGKGIRASELLGKEKHPIIVCDTEEGGFLRYLEGLSGKHELETSEEDLQNVITGVSKDIPKVVLNRYLSFSRKYFSVKKKEGPCHQC